MKALILVGGYGTRLRPLTFSKPKPVIPLLNEPIVMHQIRALQRVGVNEVVLAISFDPTMMREELEPLCKKIGVRLEFSLEKTPLGTAGPLALAKESLTRDGNELFFVLNSDVTADYPFERLLKLFKEKNVEGCIVGKRVEDPSRFGVIVHDKDYKVERFVEKPQVFCGDLINAGMYLLDKKVLDRIPYNVRTSIERKTFPAMASEGQLYCLPYEEFWMDIGKPMSFLEGMVMLFDHRKGKEEEEEEGEGERKYEVVQPVKIEKGVVIGEGSVVGPYVCLGKGVKVGKGVRLKTTSVMEGCTLEDYSQIEHSIIGWNSKIRKWAKVMGGSILGEDVTIGEGCIVNGVTVCLHKSVGENILEKGKIIL